MAKLKIPCKTCDNGTMTKRKTYRMSGIVVVIGYLILVPSLLGVALGVLSLGAGAASVSSDSEVATYALRETTRSGLRAAGVPEATVLEIEKGRPLAASGAETLSDVQQAAVQEATAEVAIAKGGQAAAAGLLGLGGLFLIFSSLVGGLLGWLLVMKKKVLQCGTCGSVVAAS